MNSMLMQTLIPAAVSGLVSFVIWFLFLRPLSDWTKRTTDLETEVRTLRDDKFAKVERTLCDHIADNRRQEEREGEKRRRIYEQQEALAVDLARLQERAEEVTGRMEGLLERQVALATDLARLEGKVNQ